MINDFLTILFPYLIILGVIRWISMWRIYEKAGQPGWATVIPVYNIIIWLRIISKPWWWIIPLCIPLVNVLVFIQMTHLLAKQFERKTGFTFGLIFLGAIFYPLLAFKEYKCTGITNSARNSTDDSQERRDKLLIYALIMLLSAFLFNTFVFYVVRIFWDYYAYGIDVIIEIVRIALISIPAFLIGISTGRKYRTLSIAISMSLLLVQLTTELLLFFLYIWT